jgi:hypothetical protein
MGRKNQPPKRPKRQCGFRWNGSEHTHQCMLTNCYGMHKCRCGQTVNG